MLGVVVSLIESIERSLEERKVVIQNIQDSQVFLVVAVVQQK